jgi:hypothetical protein
LGGPALTVALVSVDTVDHGFRLTLTHVDEFNGVGKAVLLTPGQHRLRIALPGYLPFDTMVDLRPQQKLKIQTDLVKGSITEAGSQVIKQ